MTRLTNEIRKQIVSSVLGATNYPKMKKALLEEECALATKIIKEHLPKNFEAAIKTLPKDWFSTRPSLYVRGTGKTAHSIFRDNAYSVSIDAIELIRVPASYKEPYSETFINRFAVLAARAAKIQEDYYNTKESLEAFLQSCSTVKKVIERMPELERHIPKTAKQYPIVADTANLLSTLFKGGFDTGVAKPSRISKKS